MRRGYHRGMSMRRRTRPVAPDQTALAAGLSGLALTVTSALVRAVGYRRCDPSGLAAAAFALGSLGGLGLGVLSQRPEHAAGQA